MEVPPWIEDFADSIIGAIIGILLVNLMYQWRAEQDLEDDMAQNLIDVLAGQYDSSKQPRLYTLFNKTAIYNPQNEAFRLFRTNRIIS